MSIDNFFVPNHHIFHCLNIKTLPEHKDTVLEYTLGLPKIFIIHGHRECPPLGVAMIKESAFCLISPT